MMPLTNSETAPATTPERLYADLKGLFPTGTLAPFLPEIALADLEISRPFAVYTPRISGLRRSEMLLAAELDRWRVMLIHDGAVVAWASLRPDEGTGEWRIVEVNVSLWIDRVVTAIETAEAHEKVASGSYELRFIESRVHSFFGLWLVPRNPPGERQPTDELVIPISDHHWSFQPGAIYDLPSVSTGLADTEDDTACST